MLDRFLVTGGAGFIGSHLVRHLLAAGGTVRVVDNLSTGIAERLADVRGAIEFIDGDLADADVAAQAVKNIDYVLHQAAIPSVQRSVRDAVGTNRSNVSATLNLLESCRQAGVRRVVYAASSSAYGDTPTLPKTEDMPANPLSPYALQKWVGERYCKLYSDLYGLATVSLRYFNVFGPRQDPFSEYSAVIPKFVGQLLAGDMLTIYGDGEQTRDFTYIDNVIEANVLSLYAPDAVGGVYNIGCGQRVSLNEVVRMLENIVGLHARVRYAPAKAEDVRHSLADIGRAQRILGYSPKINMEEGLRRTVEHLKSAT